MDEPIAPDEGLLAPLDLITEPLRHKALGDLSTRSLHNRGRDEIRLRWIQPELERLRDENLRLQFDLHEAVELLREVQIVQKRSASYAVWKKIAAFMAKPSLLP